MIYAYHCDVCGHSFDVIKPAAEYQSPELCPVKNCGAPARKEFAPRRTYLSGTAVQEAEYNPGLGCVVKNKQERAEICKRRGLEEIGSATPESIHKHYDRRREERHEREWAETTKGWVGNGE